MRKNIDISDEQVNEFLRTTLWLLDSGYAFEEFLKVYLEKIGLDEVIVTQRSSDGGIDLKKQFVMVLVDLMAQILWIIMCKQKEYARCKYKY